MAAVFLETSALLSAVFGQSNGPGAARAIEDADRLVASRLLKVEAERALLRLALDEPQREAQVPNLQRQLSDLWSRTDMLEITPAICNLAGRIAPRSRLRALDAIHVATYYTARSADPAIRMLSFDARILACLQTG